MSDVPPPKKRAPTLYAIIAMKLLKGGLLLAAAITAYTLSDNDLPYEFKRLLGWLHLDPGNRFFKDLAALLGRVTETQALHVALGTLLYSLFSLVEGVGLMFRAWWAGWLAIGESAFFIPIEIHELMKRPSRVVLVILMLNVLIVWYLFENRQRLFWRHYHHPPHSR